MASLPVISILIVFGVFFVIGIVAIILVTVAHCKKRCKIFKKENTVVATNAQVNIDLEYVNEKESKTNSYFHIFCFERFERGGGKSVTTIFSRQIPQFLEIIDQQKCSWLCFWVYITLC